MHRVMHEAMHFVQGLSEAWDEEDARGYVMGFDDPSMGWCAGYWPITS